MKQILLIIALCFFIADSFAQQKHMDSLRAALGNHLKEDTIRAGILIALSEDYSAIDPAKGLEIADGALYLSEKLHDNEKIASAYSNKGDNYWARSMNGPALEMYQKASSMFQQMHDEVRYAMVCNEIGNVYLNTADYIQALENFEKAEEIIQRNNNRVLLAKVMGNIGIVYNSMSDYPKALDYGLKSLKVCEEVGDKMLIAKSCLNISNIYAATNNYPKTLEYQNRALALFEQMDSKMGVAFITNFQRSLEASEAIEYIAVTASDLMNIGIVFADSGDYYSAISYLEKAIVILEKINNKDNLCLALTRLGLAYAEAPDNVLRGKIPLAQRYAKAMAYEKNAMQISLEIGSLDLKYKVLLNISVIYERQKSYQDALKTYREAVVVQDSIYTDTKKQEIAQKGLQFDFGKREDALKAANDKKQALAAAEITRQRTVRNSAIGGSLLLLIAAATTFGFYKRKRDADQAKKDAELKAQVTDTELKALRAQMNPHFIFNSLNSISDYIARNETQAAGNYLTKFARLMRTILENSEEKEVPLAEDLEALEWYMQLEALRMNHKFTYTINVSADIDPQTAMIPPMILQPFVENSIWHGLSRKAGGNGHIKIEVRKDGQMLRCIVEDNGVGRSDVAISVAMPGKTSLGMKITQSRIDVINQQKGTSASIQITFVT